MKKVNKDNRGDSGAAIGLAVAFTVVAAVLILVMWPATWQGTMYEYTQLENSGSMEIFENYSKIVIIDEVHNITVIEGQAGNLFTVIYLNSTANNTVIAPMFFEGNLTSNYTVGDSVQITVTDEAAAEFYETTGGAMPAEWIEPAPIEDEEADTHAEDDH